MLKMESSSEPGDLQPIFGTTHHAENEGSVEKKIHGLRYKAVRNLTSLERP